MLMSRRAHSIIASDNSKARVGGANSPAYSEAIGWVRHLSNTEIVIGTRIKAGEGPAVANYLSSIIIRLNGGYSLEFIDLEKNPETETFAIKARVNRP